MTFSSFLTRGALIPAESPHIFLSQQRQICGAKSFIVLTWDLVFSVYSRFSSKTRTLNSSTECVLRGAPRWIPQVHVRTNGISAKRQLPSGPLRSEINHLQLSAEACQHSENWKSHSFFFSVLRCSAQMWRLGQLLVLTSKCVMPQNTKPREAVERFWWGDQDLPSVLFGCVSIDGARAVSSEVKPALVKCPVSQAPVEPW